MRTACVYHRIDLDGWMSAAIVKHWFNTNEREAVFTEGNTTYSEKRVNQITFIGYHYGDPIPDLSKCDQVIMVDISFPKEEMFKLFERLDEDFIYLDHHISAINDSIDNGYKACNGIRTTKLAACQLTWQYFFPDIKIPEIVSLLSDYDSFRNTSKKVLEFQYGARQRISNYEEAYGFLIKSIKGGFTEDTIEYKIWKEGKSIYQYLCTEAKQTYKNGFVIHFRNDIKKGNVIENGILRFICINKERFNPINFGIDYHKDGYYGVLSFYFDGKLYQCSIYNDNGQIDCSVIAKQFGGGGHKGAAGFRLTVEQFNNLINGA